jgi:hypothetical protein
VNRHFAALYWGAVRQAIERMRMAAMLLTFVVSLLLLLLTDVSPTETVLNVSKAAMLGVSGSFFAASLFLLLQSLIDAVAGAKEDVYKRYYEAVADRYGVKALFSQRGGDDVISLYSRLIASARSRIWAVGMTNRHFLLQHEEPIIEALRSHRIDVRISFWDPDATIQAHGEATPLIGLQDLAETGGVRAGSDWSRVIKDRQRAFATSIAGAGPLRGAVRIMNSRSPAAFSCLIVDDDVFFFPFLAMPESTNHPTLHCGASSGVGRDVAKHVGLLFSNELLSTIVYHRADNEDRVNRIE